MFECRHCLELWWHCVEYVYTHSYNNYTCLLIPQATIMKLKSSWIPLTLCDCEFGNMQHDMRAFVSSTVLPPSSCSYVVSGATEHLHQCIEGRYSRLHPLRHLLQWKWVKMLRWVWSVNHLPLTLATSCSIWWTLTILSIPSSRCFTWLSSPWFLARSWTMEGDAGSYWVIGTNPNDVDGSLTPTSWGGCMAYYLILMNLYCICFLYIYCVFITISSSQMSNFISTNRIEMGVIQIQKGAARTELEAFHTWKGIRWGFARSLYNTTEQLPIYKFNRWGEM